MIVVVKKVVTSEAIPIIPVSGDYWIVMVMLIARLIRVTVEAATFPIIPIP